MAAKTLLLASNSPRRQQLLTMGGWVFDIAYSRIDEYLLPCEPPAGYVLRLAQTKARASARLAKNGNIIIAADTVVVDVEDILGKPIDQAEARFMLQRLRGHAHKVYTGIAVLCPGDDHLLSDLCVTDVFMRSYSDEEIEAYVQTGDPLDKAGSYAIQHPSFQPVEHIDGCFASVMGLPLCHLERSLLKMDYPSVTDVPNNCQSGLHYQCPVYPSILRVIQAG